MARVLTDHDELSDNITIAGLVWEDDTPQQILESLNWASQGYSIEWIVGSDLVFNDGSIEPLVSVLKGCIEYNQQMAKDDTVMNPQIIMAVELRNHTVFEKYLYTLVREGFAIEQIHDLHPDFHNSCVFVHRIHWTN